ncbi:MFS transporter [Tunturiibacter gelidoferens]|uniref:DHA2 family multidrug resistance protein n=1 Tax=Tunturiibacter lichenicola TaxID=2051959 RepID=A0A7Y9T6M0_9BACT|nr:MFS transporter [Edaphobacter lichenicola]NYF53474.1 DHA2 family multidrug resistance protein [Edaphobacter lichenicola]
MKTGPQIESVQRIRPVLGIVGVLLGASLATFFGRLLSVGAPDLRGALGIDVDSASWIGTTYNMGMMFIGPFSVYLGGLLGPRRVLLVSATIFTLLCIAMPFAGHLPVLLFLLAAAGMTAGTFYPLTLSFILRNLPQSYLLFGIAAYAADIVVTTHMAHSYEGWLMDALSWQWIFWTTALLAPIMISLVVLGIPPQPIPKPKPGQPSPSWRGFLYFSLGAALLYGAMDQGQRLDWWRSGTFVAMVVSGSFLILATAVRHFSKPNPLINFPFLRRRNTILLGMVIMIFRFVLLSAVVLVPSYLTAIRGYRPEQVGPVLLWLAIPQCLAGLLAIYLLGRIDSRLILAAGFATVAVAALMDSHITSVWSGNSFELSQIVLAMGEGFAFNGMVGTIVLDLMNSGSMDKGPDVLSFSGFFQTIRLFGGELGASYIQFFLHSRQVFHADLLSADIQGGSTPVVERTHMLTAGMHAQSVTQDIATGRAAVLFMGSIRQQAFTLSIMDAFTFIAYVATTCLLIIACLRGLKVGFRQIIATSAQSAS